MGYSLQKKNMAMTMMMRMTTRRKMRAKWSPNVNPIHCNVNPGWINPQFINIRCISFAIGMTFHTCQHGYSIRESSFSCPLATPKTDRNTGLKKSWSRRSRRFLPPFFAWRIDPRKSRNHSRGCGGPGSQLAGPAVSPAARDQEMLPKARSTAPKRPKWRGESLRQPTELESTTFHEYDMYIYIHIQIR